MKQTLSIVLMLVLVVNLSSCHKKSSGTGNNGNGTSNDITTEVPYTKTKTLDTLPPLPVSLPIILTDTFATKSDEYLTTYGFTKDRVKKIWATYMNVYIDNSNTQTFDFVDDSVKIYVKAYNGTDSTLVAYKYGILPGAKTMDFTMIDTDLKNYFNSQYMQVTMTFNTKPNQAMKANTNFVSNFKFKITGTP